VQEYYLGAMALDGNLSMIMALIENGGFDPSFNDSYALRMAAIADKYNVVEYLMNEGRSDPSARYNYAIHRAVGNNSIEMVKLLLTDERVAVVSAFMLAVTNNQYDICKAMIEARDFLDSDRIITYRSYAKRCGNLELMQLF
jgi:aspartokinase